MGGRRANEVRKLATAKKKSRVRRAEGSKAKKETRLSASSDHSMKSTIA